MATSLQDALLRFPRPYYLAAIASLGTLVLLRSLRHGPVAMIPSPRETVLPHLTPEEAQQLPYPPDPLPGRRDVDSPLGEYRDVCPPAR